MKNLFTMILSHYNQMQYIKGALMSILVQNYEKIELIITDDGSKEFDKEEIIDFIEKNKRNNLVSYDFVINKENIGTVKTFNKALKKAKGEYVAFLAADDELYNKSVIRNYVEGFKNNDTNVVTAQAYMYDKKLEEIFEPYIDVKKAYKFNELSSFEQFERMSISCVFSAGATCYKKSVIEKHGFFDEDYRIVEDWTYWLKILREGEKMMYIDFPALKHRDGGVSHNNTKDLPPHVIAYYNDLLLAYKKEILPFIKKIDINIQAEIIDKYLFHIDIFGSRNDKIKENYSYERHNFYDIYDIDESQYRFIVLKRKLKNFVRWQIIDRFLHPFRYNKVMYLSLVLWLIISSWFNFFINSVQFNNVFLPIVYLFIYYVSYKIIIDILKTDFIQPYSMIIACLVPTILINDITNVKGFMLLFLISYIVSFYLILFVNKVYMFIRKGLK